MADLGFHVAAEDGLLTFGATTAPFLVRGISQLVQEVCLELLSDFKPELNHGSGLSRLLTAVASNDTAGAQNAVEEALDATRRHIKARQSSNPALTPEERLDDLRLLSVQPDGTLTWKIALELIPRRGDAIAFEVPGVGNDSQ